MDLCENELCRGKLASAISNVVGREGIWNRSFRFMEEDCQKAPNMDRRSCLRLVPVSGLLHDVTEIGALIVRSNIRKRVATNGATSGSSPTLRRDGIGEDVNTKGSTSSLVSSDGEVPTESLIENDEQVGGVSARSVSQRSSLLGCIKEVGGNGESFLNVLIVLKLL